jgi:hypothetical protein
LLKDAEMRITTVLYRGDETVHLIVHII